LLKHRMVARHYALAFYPLIESGFGDNMKIIEEISGVIQDVQELDLFLNHPLFKIENKKDILSKITHLETHPEIERFFLFLIEKKKLYALPEILEELHNVHREKQLVKSVMIKSASVLSDSQKTAIVESISRISGCKIDPVFIIEEDLISGLLIKMGDEVIDASFKGSLRVIKEELTKFN
jgi:F-type H+-transporting ATPase subunit delta